MGEEKAVKFLTDNGYEIIKRNYRTKFGEIDIVAKEKEEIVFVEVKTRSSKKYGIPREAVDKNKINHIINVSKYFILKNNLENYFLRFDIIEIYVLKNNYIINHIKNVFF